MSLRDWFEEDMPSGPPRIRSWVWLAMMLINFVIVGAIMWNAASCK